MIKYDLLVKGGILVDPANNRHGRFDIGLAEGQVVDIHMELSPDNAREVYNASGKLVFPGLVDTHVHLTMMEGMEIGYQMLARAGVTCALDCAGPVEDVVKGMAAQGSGISVAVLNFIAPGLTINGADAGKKELSSYLDQSLKAGSLGLKLLGGHLPLTPETTSCAIEVCNDLGAYVAFHCGSTRNGSNLNGLMDAFEFAGNNRLQLCHINAYCRGQTGRTPVDETMIALKELAARRHFVSESHMATYNCCMAHLEDGLPLSHVTRTCLETGGYEVSRDGFLDAARAGYARVHQATPRGVVLLKAKEGVDYLESVNFQTMISFPVNQRSTAFLTATEKDEKGDFVITALSSDGGGFPRNFILSHGLNLVRFDALSLSELVQKCSWMPARMLGLPEKGHLGLGADADLAVIDPGTHQVCLTLAGGQIIMINDLVIGKGGTLITTERFEKDTYGAAVPNRTADLENSLFYNA